MSSHTAGERGTGVAQERPGERGSLESGVKGCRREPGRGNWRRKKCEGTGAAERVC